MNNKIVYNAEPFGFSRIARQSLIHKGFSYIEGSWNQIMSSPQLSGVVGLVVRLHQRVDKAVLDRFPDLEWIISATTGHDHIDLDELKERGLRLISLRGHDDFLNTIPSTAEHTWALLMALIRNIPAADNHVMEGKWNRDRFRGHQLKGKTIGIIGLGRTGRKLATYASAFDMTVCYFDPYVEIADYDRCQTINNLVQKSDVVSLNVHLSESTYQLLNSSNLTQAKPGAFLLNTSRGNVWNEKAIAEKLHKKELGGVAADVLSSELDNITKSPLWIAKNKGFNVVLTPHIGGATWEAMWTCEEYVVKLI